MPTHTWQLLVLLLFTAACSSDPSEQAPADDKQLVVNELMEAPALVTAEAAQVEQSEVRGNDQPDSPEANEPFRVTAAPGTTRKIIYHANVRVKVDDLARANARMDSLTRAFGAYVSDASERREDGQWEHQMTIRVLPSRFPALLNRLNGLGTLESKTLGTDDVTAEHADVSARLATKRALEQRYIALLKQAKKVSEMLEIEGKIGEVRADIEATESKLKTLNDQVAYSTINLSYFQVITLKTPDAPVLSFGSRLVQSFYSGWELCTNLLLGMVAAWPLWLLLLVIIWSIRVWRRRRTLSEASA
ncbi:DUF4349 domain-containing protein [Hymenobacter metallicola]|uniref:DUF4349 domain-containing protein n=1 Tax=Hymenobacter metallicola TaxID=2563114 RepID=A0A4Z0QG03_9BACT|nr:DUF4349 domain-containing protein [Hymenobacter metallicola]TGE28978.1 DUF4349 domain-containing protein [Hymenobacter metallicola]